MSPLYCQGLGKKVMSIGSVSFFSLPGSYKQIQPALNVQRQTVPLGNSNDRYTDILILSNEGRCASGITAVPLEPIGPKLPHMTTFGTYHDGTLHSSYTRTEVFVRSDAGNGYYQFTDSDVEYAPEGGALFGSGSGQITYKATHSVDGKVVAQHESKDRIVGYGQWHSDDGREWTNGRTIHIMCSQSAANARLEGDWLVIGNGFDWKYGSENSVHGGTVKLVVTQSDKAESITEQTAEEKIELSTRDLGRVLGGFFGKTMSIENPFTVMFGSDGLLSFNADSLPTLESKAVQKVLDEINAYLIAKESGEDTEGMLSPVLTGIADKLLALKEVMGSIHDKSLIPKEVRFGVNG